MAIPMVIGNTHVAAIIQSERCTLPENIAPALDQLINHLIEKRIERSMAVIEWRHLDLGLSGLSQSSRSIPPIPNSQRQLGLSRMADCSAIV
jgi:hypothetical protein